MTNFLFEGRKAVCCVLVLDTSLKQWKTLHQQEEREHRALVKSILQIGATREVQAVPVAG